MSPETSKSPSSFWTWVAVLGVCLAGLLATFILFVEAPPPSRIVIATGREDGAYYRFAQQYTGLLKKAGITLEVQATKGSVENLSLLLDEDSDVSVALVQSGVADPATSSSLQALCSLYREPLWVFYRDTEEIDRLTQLNGKRLAVGPEGSGTRSIALHLLKANDIDASEAQLVDLAGREAAEALTNHQIDAAFFVAGVDAAYIQQLLKEPEIRLVEFAQAEAYARRFRFLSTLTIPSGGLLDLKDNLPAKNTVLVAPAATLITRKSLHPALISLLLSVATKVHSGGDVLTNPGEFPSASFTDLPLSEDAAHYFRFGPPVLQRVLPFWLASLLDRLKIMIIPLIVVMMPLLRAAPPLVRWRTRRKIYLWYEQLHQIDQKAIQGMSLAEAQKSLDALNVLEQQVAQLGVPLSYMEEYYNLRLHLNLVRTRVTTILGADRHMN